jgi:hypothetical protein
LYDDPAAARASRANQVSEVFLDVGAIERQLAGD